MGTTASVVNVGSGPGDLVTDIVAWAAARDDIRALIQTGSRAREDGRVDAWSDFDIEVFTTRPEAYESSDWMAPIGDVWVCLPLSRDDDARYRMRLTVFDGGQKVDFAVAPLEVLREQVERGRLSAIYERGYLVLLDKDGVAARFAQARRSRDGPSLPDQAAFRAVVDEFWFEASEIPKYLVRDEPWVVKFRDWTMKTLLLRMLEWHAVATRGPDTDVWHIGRDMRDWAAPEFVDRLATVFGRFDRIDSWQALLATCDLFRDVATATGKALGFPYPDAVDAAISGYVESFGPLIDPGGRGATFRQRIIE